MPVGAKDCVDNIDAQQVTGSLGRYLALEIFRKGVSEVFDFFFQVWSLFSCAGMSRWGYSQMSAP
jgi:hypothetical protein